RFLDVLNCLSHVLVLYFPVLSQRVRHIGTTNAMLVWRTRAMMVVAWHHVFRLDLLTQGHTPTIDQVQTCWLQLRQSTFRTGDGGDGGDGDNGSLAERRARVYETERMTIYLLLHDPLLTAPILSQLVRHVAWAGQIITLLSGVD